MRQILFCVLFAVLAGFVFSDQSQADEWPQWRGARLDNVSDEKNIPGELDSGKHLLWRTELDGPAGSSPIVWGDNIFLTTVREDSLWLCCYSTSGKLNWKQELSGVNKKVRDAGNSASPSPSTDGKHVWSMMTNGVIECFTVAGEPVWKNDLQKEYGAFNIAFGMTSTPILDRGRLYVQLIHGSMREKNTSTGWVLALDAKTGKEIWKHERKTDAIAENKHSYASPTLYRDKNSEFLITHGGDFAIGHSLKDGSEIWRCGGINPRGENGEVSSAYNPYLRFVSSPVCVPGMIIVPSAKKGPVLSLKPKLSGNVSGKTEALHWKMDRGTPDVSTPVVYGDLIYLTRENGVLSIVDAKNGNQLFAKRMFADMQRSSPVAADGKLFVVDRKGNLSVLKAGAEGTLLSKINLNEETTASPAIAGGRIYIRTFKALYAFGNKGEGTSKTKTSAVGTKSKMKYAIALHGGAGSPPSRYSDEANMKRRKSLTRALRVGQEILENGGTAMEAVEKVVLDLEEDPNFNAGVGAVFNAAGSHELDASIMDGSDLSCGAVAGVSRVRNPIKLARMVMTDTKHVLLAGDGADAFAEKQNLEMVSPSFFDTPATKSRWEKIKRKIKEEELSPTPDGQEKINAIIRDSETGSYMGTVGCVALDAKGNLAAATSTGGMSNKQFGRVGDSPIVGAGTYADNRTCAISGTGYGEQYIRHAVAYDVSAQMMYRNVSLREAVTDNLTKRLDKNDGGIIGVDKDGNIVMDFNSRGMARAAADSSGRFEVFWDDGDNNVATEK